MKEIHVRNLSIFCLVYVLINLSLNMNIKMKMMKINEGIELKTIVEKNDDTPEAKTDEKSPNIADNKTQNKATATETKNNKNTLRTAKKSIDKVPRGLPKSNRPWKTPKTKFTTIKKTLNRDPLDKKQKLRNDLRRIKEWSKEIKEQRKEDLLHKHQRRVENAERRLANERKSELVQIIKNPAKLKRLKKKHLRMIEKRDLNQSNTV